MIRIGHFRKKLAAQRRREQKAKEEAAKAAENAKIDAYNTNEREEGRQKDQTAATKREDYVLKNGTVEYKSFIKRHRDEIKNILGIRSK